MPPLALFLLFAVSIAMSIAGLLMPGLILFGYFALILPGLALSLAPAAAMYFGLSLVGWPMCIRLGRRAALAGSITLPAICAIVPPVLVNLGNNAAIDAAVQPDVGIENPVGMVGDVLIRQPAFRTYGQRRLSENSCDDLCHMLLLSGAVDSVTMAGPVPDRGMRYRITEHQPCQATAVPDRFFWQGWPEGYRPSQFSRAASMLQAEGSCILGARGGGAPHDMTILLDKTSIALPWSWFGANLSATAFRLEIRSREEIVSRQTRVRTERLFTPLVLFNGFGAGGGNLWYKGLYWVTDNVDPYVTLGHLRSVSAVEAALDQKLAPPDPFGDYKTARP